MYFIYYSAGIYVEVLSVMKEFSYLDLSERMPNYDLQAHFDQVVPNPKLLTITDPLSLSFNAMQ
jgi:hypothetical protein